MPFSLCHGLLLRRSRQRCLRLAVLVLFGFFVAIHLFSVFANHKASPAGSGMKLTDPPARSIQAGLGTTQSSNVSLLSNLSSGSIATKDGKASGGHETKLQNSLSGERSHLLPTPDVGNSSSATKREQQHDLISLGSTDIPSILKAIREHNERQFIRNMDLFGPVEEDTVIIAIQVHNRVRYLFELVQSLSKAKDIQKTLLIFSHDFWDPDINKIIEEIDFAKCMQIFYPYSIQTHPHEFPGESPHDCKRDAKKSKSGNLNCINQAWPDLYGHYREAKFSQTKHHWWWKANRIFDQLEITRGHRGLVLFLEEDHLVAEDFLHVLKMVEAERVANHQDCDIICLGTYLKHSNFPREGRKAIAKHSMDLGTYDMMRGLPPRLMIMRRQLKSISEAGSRLMNSLFQVFSQVAKIQWMSSKHNMGMAFTRDLWLQLHECRMAFCNFDDYNWDWSLHHVSLTCLTQSLKVLLVKAPRVFHVGECGVHHKKKDCEISSAIEKVRKILTQASKFLFPKTLEIQTLASKKKVKVPKGNGGWGDRRDRALCLNMGEYNVSSWVDVVEKLERAASLSSVVSKIN